MTDLQDFTDYLYKA